MNMSQPVSQSISQSVSPPFRSDERHGKPEPFAVQIDMPPPSPECVRQWGTIFLGCLSEGELIID